MSNETDYAGLAEKLEALFGGALSPLHPHDTATCLAAVAALREAGRYRAALQQIADRPTAVGVNPQGLVDYARAALGDVQ